MHKSPWLAAALLSLGLLGCRENSTAPRVDAPAAPRGLYSVTGDQSVTLNWLANTEAGITGYRVYKSTCATECPYGRVGATTQTSFVVPGLVNGQTAFFAVTAVGPGGNESALSYETVYDTPRPQGTGAVMTNIRHPGATGWDFSAMHARAWNDPQVDFLYSRDTLNLALIYSLHDSTDIQDAGYASLDAVDFAPDAGWSPTHSVEAIPGHCYVVWTHEDNFAKFRVTSVTDGSVVFDWAYQTVPGNGELQARRAGRGPAVARRAMLSQR